MSHDVKYIGMDVHKEAIVIAVQNESGKLVIESVIETKASSILQFLHGLRGELHVTWEAYLVEPTLLGRRIIRRRIPACRPFCKTSATLSGSCAKLLRLP